MIGIYKITSPNGKIYVGQSIDIERRFRGHKTYKQQSKRNKLYNSLKKYGYYNHKFEVIEECDVDFLNELERYWQDFYNEKNILLNTQFTKTNDKRGYLTEYHKKLLRKPKCQIKLENNRNNKIKKPIVKTTHKALYVLDTETGVYYHTVSEASLYSIYSDRILRRMLLGWRKNTTNLILV